MCSSRLLASACDKPFVDYARSYGVLYMKALPQSIRWVIPVGLLAVVVFSPFARTEGPNQDPVAASSVDFNREVLPILSEHCFACHGPDAKARKARLRLDTEDGLAHVVTPGKLTESALIERITTSDPDDLMPPKKFDKPLTSGQIATLKQWVESGAKWERVWALTAPSKPTVPSITQERWKTWPRNAIDAFVFAKMQGKGLAPSPEADRITWIRRVTLDLTGLPPKPADVDAFLADQSPQAYERVVDRLFASPKYGEHMARYWLDAARYGDTHGLHLDNYREMWPYREWVIESFQKNQPYDKFIVEQIAGDLLPNAEVAQQVATGFLRCHITTSEGGSIEEEVHVRNVVDRVDTLGTVVLGLTVACARCHDHKYDPISQKDYYALFAFFNSIEGSDLDGNAARHAPVVTLPSPEQTAKLAEHQAELAKLNQQIAKIVATTELSTEESLPKATTLKRREVVWIDDALPAGSQPLADGGINQKWNFVSAEEFKPASGKKSLVNSATELSQLVVQGVTPGLRVGEGDKLFAHVYIDPEDPPQQIMLQWHSDTWRHRAYWGENRIQWGKDRSPERRQQGQLPKPGSWVRLEVNAAQVGLTPGTVITGWAFTQFGGTVHWDKAGILTATPQGSLRYPTLSEFVAARGEDTAIPKPIRDIIKLDAEKRSESQTKKLNEYFIEYGYSKTAEAIQPLHQLQNTLNGAIKTIENEIPATYVFKERATPRQAFILNRGEYDQRGDKVDRATPSALPPLPPGAPLDRMGLAQWLTSPEHPLVSRVFVNRLWQQFFGTGIVKTVDDFGAQGEPPTHPELLDYMAVDFREQGWDVQKLIRSIVLSATYRQSSKVNPEVYAKDPNNRLLARGPRHRLDAEVIRDQALFVSGLLVDRVGGPSVKPPQPAGLWEAVGYSGSNTARFNPDKGPDKIYRRSLYTFWKRTSPPPQMTTLDAPSREACTVRRERTNTPLQALLLMNETQFVEAAKLLAQRALNNPETDSPEARVEFMFREVLTRKPEPRELTLLVGAYEQHRTRYAQKPADAKALLAYGEFPTDAKLSPLDHAALAMVANVILNLDEALTKH